MNVLAQAAQQDSGIGGWIAVGVIVALIWAPILYMGWPESGWLTLFFLGLVGLSAAGYALSQ